MWYSSLSRSAFVLQSKEHAEVDHRIEVYPQAGRPDGRAVDLLAQIAHLGITAVHQVDVSNLYFLRGNLTPSELKHLAAELLVDPVVEDYRCGSPLAGSDLVVEVGFHPGVTDPVAENLLLRARMLGLGSVEAAATAMRYVFTGAITPVELQRIAREVLCNEVIQTYALGILPPAFVPAARPSDTVEVIPLRDASDEELARLSVERVLFLSLPEMQSVQAEFRRLERDPTDVELETLAQTWSEHCQHKAFKGRISYSCRGGMQRVVPLENEGDEALERISESANQRESESSSHGSRVTGHASRVTGHESPVTSHGQVDQPVDEEDIPGLLSTYIRAATERLNKPWVLSAFVDNAGIVAFGEGWEVSFKVETHNHPSALEPFGGANTGVGGVIRDVMGVSHRPIANTDVLCFGPVDLPAEEVPVGTLHPRRIARGVVAGIEDYGNKMGVPTVGGAILYDRDYTANPLVYCGCVGLAPRGRHRRDARPGDLCVALGGRTGRDGLHGATFSSAELTPETGQTVGSVVQIGDPITEKAVLEAILRARDEGLYTAITDCGAGGFSSAAGEMGQAIGVEVDLAAVRLKYPGLRPWEIWLSEAQERMVLAVPPEHLPRLGEICAGLDVDLTVIGHFTGDSYLRVRYGERVAAELEMVFLHHGWPRRTMAAEWVAPAFPEPDIAPLDDRTPTLLRLLAYPDVASKEDVIRRYDHEVQGATVVKPLVGVRGDGPGDAAVLRPLEVPGWQGIALGCGISPSFGRIDPYAMAWAVVDEALRNVVAVGADPDAVALLDNFCWGNPNLPDRLGGLVRAAQGCYDAALAYGAPFISGKDSLNNEFAGADGQKHAIPPTLLVSSLGLVPDVRAAVTMDLKEAGDLLYVVGETRAELGGSLYYRLHGALGRSVPAPVPKSIQTMRALHRAIRRGLVRACHDLSEGGLAVAAAEMALAGRLGLELSLSPLPRAATVDRVDLALFSESAGRFLVEVASKDAPALEAALAGTPFACLGHVAGDGLFCVRGLAGEVVIVCAVAELVYAWKKGVPL
jgi:phosphoribosylformylglycinamidine synthase